MSAIECRNQVLFLPPAGRCDDLQNLENGTVSSTMGSNIQSEARYVCFYGYRLIGRPTRVCQEAGRWSYPAPCCEPSTCSDISVGRNVEVTQTNGNFVYSLATHTCHEGYRLNGNQMRQCQPSGIWSGRPPSCIPIVCPPIYAPNKGNFSLSDRTCYRSEAVYTCNDGYVLSGGDMIRTCQSTMLWSGKEPCCVRETVECPVLTGILSGTVEVEEPLEPGAVATYSCSSGHSLDGGSRERVCLEGGVWSGTEPRCVPDVIPMCEVIFAPAFGGVSVTGRELGGTAEYSCNPGYIRSGDRTRTCLSPGMWSGNAPTCEPVDCGVLFPPANGIVVVGTTTLGSVATYSCDPSLRIVGTDSRDCQEDGTWSGETPTCEVIDCGSLISPANGTVDLSEGSLLGAMATYSCDPSFTPIGMSSRVCQEDETWSGEAPTCIAIDCGELDGPADGSVDISQGSLLGAEAIYTCDPSFRLVGTSIRQCQDNGSWSGEAPTCAVIDCGSLMSPANGAVDLSEGSLLGAMATYSCDPSFTPIGMSSRVCQDNETWSGEAPTCKVIDCGGLEPPDNGAVDVSEGSLLGAVATYSCDPSFTLVGMDSRQCEEDGWTGEPPTCEDIVCPVLEDPEFGSVTYEGGRRGVGSDATYACQPRYSIIGDPVRICLVTREWSGQAPTCELLECPSLENPPNGMVTVMDNVPGSVAMYICDSGYMLSAQGDRTCERVGARDTQWGGVPPTCTLIMCPLLEDPDNGRVTTPPPYPVDSTAVYACNRGFESSSGSIRRVCMADGTWSSTAPVCIVSIVACPSNLGAPEFGSVVIRGNATLGSTALYSCQLGYQVVGEPERRCQLNGLIGVWGGEEPTCEAVMCPQLEDPVDGFLRITGLAVEAETVYFCDSGFERNGLLRRECLPTGNWSGQDTVCDPRPGTVSCGRLNDPDQGTVAHETTTPGSVATYSCTLGYVLVGGARERRCQDNGTWDGTEPTCDVIDCGPLSDPVNGMVLVSLDTTLGATARYDCIPGYKLTGLSGDVRFCTVTGEWSETDPTCERVDCGPLSPPVNGVVDQSRGTRFTDETLYTCLEGYVLTPSDSQIRICTETGQWSGSDPTCDLSESTVDCGPPPLPPNAVVTLLNSSTGLLALAEYSCRPGFLLEGDSFTQCQSNALWSGTLPTCARRQCPPLEAPENGRIFVEGLSVGSSVTYLCNSGYTRVGLLRRVCQNNGEWTGDDTRCLRMEDVTCPPLTPPTNGLISGGEGEQPVGSTASYSCDEGYSLEGSQQRTCRSDGLWSGMEPTCERIQCPDPGVPEDGRRLGDNFEIGESVLFLCSDGFEPDGMSTLICLANGTWSNPTPTCTVPTTTGSRTRRGSCSGSSEDERLPTLGERCSCVAGQLVSCCRLRQEWSQLSSVQQERYIAAVRTASMNPLYRPAYVRIMQLYLEAFESVVLNENPDTSLFFPWHRYYLSLYEDLLRVIDRSVTIPYWDWTLTPDRPYESQVFDPVSGFGNSTDNVTHCVNSGPFREGLFRTSPQAGDGCVKRTYRNFPFFNRQLLDSTLLAPATSFTQLHSALQLFFHFQIRCFVGGTMCTNFASEDPVYLLLLAQLDRLLDAWQRQDEDRAGARYNDDPSPLVPTLNNMSEELKVSDYSSNKELPYGVSVCYSVPPPPLPAVMAEPE
jgi:hypothetical protein